MAESSAVSLVWRLRLGVHAEVLQVSVSSLNYFFAKIEVLHCTWLCHVNIKICRLRQ